MNMTIIGLNEGAHFIQVLIFELIQVDNGHVVFIKME